MMPEEAQQTVFGVFFKPTGGDGRDPVLLQNTGKRDWKKKKAMYCTFAI